MAIEVYLNFNGNCREAVEFYSQAFNTPMQPIMTFGDGEASAEFPIPENAKHLVMHTYLTIAGDRVMFSDAFPGQPVTCGDNINVTIMSDNIDEIKAHFVAIHEGVTIAMDLQETFWSKCFGMVTDRFGVVWQFSHSAKKTADTGSHRS